MLLNLLRANPLLWKAVAALCVSAFIAGGWGGWWLRSNIADAAQARAESMMRAEVEAIRTTQNEQARDLASKRDAITAWEQNGRNALYALMDAGGLGLGCDVGADGLRWWNDVNQGLGFTRAGAVDGMPGGTAARTERQGARFNGEPFGRSGAIPPVPRPAFGFDFSRAPGAKTAALVE